MFQFFFDLIIIISNDFRVSGSELVQKFIGEGSRMVRELFVMARYTYMKYIDM